MPPQDGSNPTRVIPGRGQPFPCPSETPETAETAEELTRQIMGAAT